MIHQAHKISNEKFEHFETVWREINEISFYIGIASSFFLIIFHQSVAFGRSEHK